jgi:hypothetical protein
VPTRPILFMQKPCNSKQIGIETDAIAQFAVQRPERRGC